MKRIEINFKNTSITKIQTLLVDYFAWNKSPAYPVIIKYEVDVYPSNTKGYVEGEFREFRVVEVYDDETYQHHVLAKIIFRKYPSGVVVFFDEEYDDIDERDWGKVEEFVKRIVEKSKLLQFELEVVETPEEKPSKRSAIDEIVHNTTYMKQFYRNYNPQTAEAIIKAIPIAWQKYDYDGGRWGPGYIGKVCNIEATTVGRYLKAFKKAGLTEIDSGGEKIEIP